MTKNARSKQIPALFRTKLAEATAAYSENELGRQVAGPVAPISASTIPTTGATRRAIDDLVPSDMEPKYVINTLRNATTDPRTFAMMLSHILRRDAGLRSVLATRVLAVVGNELVVEPGGTKLKDRKAAEACLELLHSDAVQEALPGLLMGGLYYGYAGYEAIWDTTARPWKLSALERLPQEWFVFDPVDGKTPLVLGEQAGDRPFAVGEGKLLWHTPDLLPGLPVLSGIGYTAAFFYALKNIALRDWTQFVELYGQPLRLGFFPSKVADEDAHRENQRVLKKALENLGRDAWAMLPDTFKIDFVEAATRSSSAEVYERISRYLEEQIAKMVLGGVLTSGTGNTGYGGSQSLGTVHNEVRMDLVKGDAKRFAATLRRWLLTPFVRWNFGADVAVPAVRFHVQEPEDLTALADALAKLIPLGLRVSADQLRDRYGLRAPEGDEEVLGAPAPAAQPAPARPEPEDTPEDDVEDQQEQARVQTAAAMGDDELDKLIADYIGDDGYKAANAEQDAQILAAVQSATTAEELTDALIKLVKTADVSKMREALTAALTTASAAGEFGVNVGGQ